MVQASDVLIQHSMQTADLMNARLGARLSLLQLLCTSPCIVHLYVWEFSHHRYAILSNVEVGETQLGYFSAQDKNVE